MNTSTYSNKKHTNLTKKQIDKAIKILEKEIEKQEIERFRRSLYGRRISLEAKIIFINTTTL